jgi:hypothetical protein
MRLMPSDPDIATIVGRIRDGSLDLQPDFQRGAVWSRAKQRLLIDSILRNWYVPPIHVVRTAEDEQEVLDGQQRLRSIFEFVRGQLTVDGSAEPYSAEINALEGLKYDELPEQVKRRFDRFTLRIFEVIDFGPEEPYELFYRLNQPTTLTSAEKRNAFFGRPREQIRRLTEHAERTGMTPDRIGFSNARLAYEDVIARFVWTLEAGTLAEKVTAGRLTERYRVGLPFPASVLDWAAIAIDTFFGAPCLELESVRLNKATAFSWLCFTARGLERDADMGRLDEFVFRIESTRTRVRRLHSDSQLDHSGPHEKLYAIFNDRATSRVNDVASVLLRDATLWILFQTELGARTPKEVDVLASAATADIPLFELEDALIASVVAAGWSTLR